MCSCLVPVIVYTKDDFISIISIFLFSYQISIFYLRNNFLFEYIKKILFFLFNFNFKKKVIIDIWQKKCRNMIAKVLNEILVIIYLKIIIINYTRKFMTESIFMSFLSDSCFFFNSKMNIYAEAMVLLIMLNTLLFGSFYCSKVKKIEHYHSKGKEQLLKKIYHNILIYSFVELNYQFYFYLSLQDSD